MENWCVILRKKAGMSQVAFSKWTGIPLRTIQSWEGEERSPAMWTVEMVTFWVEENMKTMKQNTADLCK